MPHSKSKEALLRLSNVKSHHDMHKRHFFGPYIVIPPNFRLSFAKVRHKTEIKKYTRYSFPLT